MPVAVNLWLIRIRYTIFCKTTHWNFILTFVLFVIYIVVISHYQTMTRPCIFSLDYGFPIMWIEKFNYALRCTLNVLIIYVLLKPNKFNPSILLQFINNQVPILVNNIKESNVDSKIAFSHGLKRWIKTA